MIDWHNIVGDIFGRSFNVRSRAINEVKPMKQSRSIKAAFFAIFIGFLASPAIAQKEKLIGVDKDGDFHIDSATRIGDRTVTKGMYQIYRVDINAEPFIVIRKVAMTNYGKTMGSLERGEEVVRLKCTIQPVAGENKKSKILVRKTAENERIALEVWFRREKLKYILPTR